MMTSLLRLRLAASRVKRFRRSNATLSGRVVRPLSESLRRAANFLERNMLQTQENKKSPAGFGNFYPKGSKPSSSSSQASKNSAAKPSSKSSEKPQKKEGGGGGSKKKSNDKKSSSKEGKPEKDEIPFFGGPNGPSRNEMGQSAALAAAMAAWMGYELFSGREDENGMEISWQEFKNEYLAAGLVERIVVINKTIARVTIRAQSEEDDGSWDESEASRERRRSQGFTLGSNSSRSGRSRENARHVFFSIGSVESFERKLEFAQRDLGVRSSEFVPVTYVAHTDWKSVLIRLSPTLLLVGLWILMMRGMSGGGMGGGGGGGPMGRIFSVGKAKPMTKTSSDVKFKDVAGCDEAKAEIMEFVKFLKSPDKFTRLGAKIPKGALLVGPPGMLMLCSLHSLTHLQYAYHLHTHTHTQVPEKHY
jgi:AFG3 family protein